MSKTNGDKKFNVFKVDVSKESGTWKITRKEPTGNHVMISERDAEIMNYNFYRSRLWYEAEKETEKEETKKPGRPAKEDK